MPSLLPSPQEIEFISDSIYEALDFYGQNVTLFPREIYSKYLDNITLEKGTSLKVLLQTNPQRKLLNNLGWFKEDKEDQKLLIFLPYKVNGQLLVFKHGDVLLFEDKMCLQITRINRDYLYGLWNIASAVSYEKDNPILADEYNTHADTSHGEVIEKTHITSPWQTMTDDDFIRKSAPK